MKRITSLISLLAITFVYISGLSAQTTTSDLASLGLHVIPYPQEVQLGGNDFLFLNKIVVNLDNNASEVDRQTAEYLKQELEQNWGLTVIVGTNTTEGILLTRRVTPHLFKTQGYSIETNTKAITISAKDEDGLFYGVQSLLQLIKKSGQDTYVPGMKILDWPDVEIRAAHYDTKHHQDKASYVKSFIRDLAKYKINMLVWEWEDKLAYESHPEIGAPGAFSIEEMQEFTKYAKKYHIELTPLVQGLGHVSFILKWPQYRDLREVEDSDWEFCPLEEGTYDLLFDLWDEAMEATPGSKYIHIGSDETFELGLCDKCQEKAKDIGNSGLYHIFANKAAAHLKKSRKVMLWERPMGWAKSRSPIKNMVPDTDLVLTEEYHYETPDFKNAREAYKMGFEMFMYDPNPGLEPLFLPYHFKIRGGKKVDGSLKASYDLLVPSADSDLFHGMINTSWDDSGLHNQMWMLSFATSAQYSWNAMAPGLGEFEESFFANYYGENLIDMKELYELLNEGAYYYTHTLERNIWHHGEIGKTHLPDLPRGQYIEYDPFWNTEYKDKVIQSRKQLNKIERALQIIQINRKHATKNAYDFEVYRSIAKLIQHTCLTYLDLSELEYTITQAHKNAFSNRKASLESLLKAEQIIENSLSRRQEVYNDMVLVWEKTRLPKGMSTSKKKYFFKMDRSRHFANRTPDMSYLLYDEQLLDMEGYLKKLKKYRESFQLEF
tara:strand:- start:30311 stop:32467 length:2157 start_codon:yes stop_codon:yes gene_type:complete